MAITKRSYTEAIIPRGEMTEYQHAFNRIRPESARLDTEPDGTRILFVRGWLDSHAAAVIQLMREGTDQTLITPETVLMKAELEGPPGPELLGQEPDEGIDPFGPEPAALDPTAWPAPPWLTEKPQPPQPGPGEAGPWQLAEGRLRALVGALAALYGLDSEELALRRAIGEAARRQAEGLSESADP